MRTIMPPRLVPESPQTKRLYPGAVSSTPMRRARNARSWPGSPEEGGTSAVVANGMVAGSQRQQSFSGGRVACFGAACLLVATFVLEFLLMRTRPKGATLARHGFSSHAFARRCFQRVSWAHRGPADWPR